MDPPSRLDANMKAIVAFGKTLDYVDDSVKAAKIDLKGMLDEIRGDGSGARHGKRSVSFALVDEAVYAAIVAAVTENGATAWTRYARLGLGIQDPPLPNRSPSTAPAAAIDPTARRLCEAILASPADEGPRRVYVDYLLERDDPRGKLLALLPALSATSVDDLAAIAVGDPQVYASATRAKLRDAFVEFVRFLAWGTRFESTCGEGQFFGYSSDDEDDDGVVKPYCDHARAKYAGMPALLAAVAANESAWRERGEMDDDDDDDE
jgi:uncharacterized protein (TIGR02996 family)